MKYVSAINNRCAINCKFDKTFFIFCRLSKGKVPDSDLEPTISRITNVVSSPPYTKCLASTLPMVIPPIPPQPNLGMASMQYSLPSVEDRSRTLGVVETVNQHFFTPMIHIRYQNKCLQPYHNKMKLALIVTVLTVVMVTVPAVYTSVINQKTEILDINTSVLTQMTKVPTGIPDINTSVLTERTEVPTEIPDINTSVLTERTEVPTANSHLTSFGM